MSKNVLVVGSNGFFGGHVKENLQSQGYNVFAWKRLSKDANHNHIVDGNISEISVQLEKNNISIIIHCATKYIRDDDFSNTESLLESNINLGFRILMAAINSNVEHFIYFKSYWERETFSHHYDPQNLYSATKAAFSVVVDYFSEKQTQCRVISLEIPETFGPKDTRSKLIPFLVESIQKQEIVKLLDQSISLSYVHINDLLGAIGIILNDESIKSGTYSIFTNNPVKLGEIIEWIKSEISPSFKVLWIDDGRNKREQYSLVYPVLPGFKQKQDFFPAFKSIINER